jgi:dephospho-CoA kinase
MTTSSRLGPPGLRKTTKPVIGLVGGIGSGKSFVAAMFAELGAAIVDGDKLGHEALRQPEIREQIVRRWGQEIVDETGEVNRRHLGLIVFSDPAERRELEQIVFPYISRRIFEELARAEQDPQIDLIVLDAAVLLEAGWGKIGDLLVFVAAPPEVRLRRIAQQRRWSPYEVETREQAQMPLEQKEAEADVVIDNSGDPAETRRQVEALVRKLRRSRPSPN